MPDLRTTSLTERLLLIDGLTMVLEGVFAHLPLKRARYGVDPVQRLRILRSEAQLLGEEPFHRALSEIVMHLRDSHTRYYWRGEVTGKVAVLPFIVEMIGTIAEPRYIVTKVSGGLDPAFVPGVVIEYWNAVPMDLAVQRRCDWEFAGRPDSQRALATQSMTMRPLQFSPPPDEHWVIVGYRAVDGAGEVTGPMREFRLPWQIIEPELVASPAASQASRAEGDLQLTRAIDPAAEAVRQAKMWMFAPGVLAGRQPQALPFAVGSGRASAAQVLPTRLPQAIRAMSIPAAGGPFGVLRLFSFEVDAEPFIAELLHLIPSLPVAGLVIDVRSNPGGYARTAEKALQLFTPRTIEPARFSLLATPLTRELASRSPMREHLAPWLPSLEAAVRNGELYSQAIPMTSPAECNAIGQRYGGPVVLVGDAMTYSAGDLFAAGFVDNGIGPFVCIGEATGAGGANVWEYARLQEMLADRPGAPPAWPEGVGLSLSFRRATRAGASEGLPIEDTGITGIPYALTRDDLLNGNVDLMERCFALIREQRRTGLWINVDPSRRRLRARTSGLDRLDVSFDGHPGSSRVLTADRSVEVTWPSGASEIELVGFFGGQIHQRRRIGVGAAHG